MSDDRSPQTADKYIVRFPDGMRDALKAAAASNSRTLNSEIIARLQATLDHTEAERNFEAVLAELQTSAATQRLRAERELQLRGGLALGLQLLYEYWEDGKDPEDPTIERQVERLLDEAEKSVEEASSALPNQAITELQHAIARVQELSRLRREKAAEAQKEAETNVVASVGEPITDKSTRRQAGLKNARKRAPK